MEGKQKFALGAVTLIVLCLTVVISLVFISLWSHRDIVAWCLLALIGLPMLIYLLHRLNEMSLRRKRYYHQDETPLDAYGNPTILQPGQQAYQPYYAQARYNGAQPHDAHYHPE